MRLLRFKREPDTSPVIHVFWLFHVRSWLRLGFASIVLTLLLLPGTSVLPQGNLLPPGAPDSSLPQRVLTGWLHVVHGDPQLGSGQASRQAVLLSDAQGNTLAEIAMDTETAETYAGREVKVTGRVIAVSAYDRLSPRLDVEMIQPEQNGTSVLSASSVVRGSQPWVNILCKFPDVLTVPHQPAEYQPLFSSTYPGLDHYWRQTSYNNINLQGTTTTAQWVTMPLPRSAYFASNGNADLGKLVTDCTNAANSAVNFPSFVGINMMFNADLDCCAWGGSTQLSLDGQTKTYRTTWLPPWSQVYSTIAHEMGHGFGFPHSTGPADDPPSDLNIYVSDWDVMSSSDGTCLTGDLQPPDGYGCYPEGTIAYNLDNDGWIPANRSTSVYPGETKTVTLEQLQLPVSTTNLLMARVPIGGSNNHFYTVEARFGSGYDQNSPVASVNGAVIIHDVDKLSHSGNGGPSYVVDALESLLPPACVLNYVLPLLPGCNDLNDDVNDTGAMWTVGESFADIGNSIGVVVQSKGASSFTVQIVNHSPPQPYPDAPSDLIFSGSTVDSASIAWQDNSFNEDGFRIYKWEDCNGVFAFCFHTSVGANVTTFTDQSLPCDTGVYYQVTAYNSNTESSATPYVKVKTDPCSPINAAPPVNYYPTGTVILTWEPVSWATGYEVQINTDASFRTQMVDGLTVGADTLYAAFTLYKGTYYWRVRAQDSAGNQGSWSTPQTITVN